MTLNNKDKVFDKFVISEEEINIEDILSPDDISSLMDIFGEDIDDIIKEKEEKVQKVEEQPKKEEKLEEFEDNNIQEEFISLLEESSEVEEGLKLKSVFEEVAKSSINCFVDKISKITNIIVKTNILSLSKDNMFRDFNLMMIKSRFWYDDIKNTEDDVFLLFSKTMIPDIIDLIFSGRIRKEYDDELIEYLKYSNIEKDLLKYFFGNFLECLNENLSRYFSKSGYKVNDIYNNSNDLIAYSIENQLVKAKIEFNIEDKRHYIYLYIPERFIDTSRLILNGFLHKEEKWKDLLEKKLIKSKITLEAKVLYEDFSFRKLLEIREGDIFYITEDNLYLVINNKPIHNIKLGIVDGGILAISLSNEENNQEKSTEIEENKQSEIYPKVL